MLVSSYLKRLIQELIDQDSADFKEFPKTIEIASLNWSNLFKTYLTTLTIPVPGSSLIQIEVLRAAFQNTLLVQLQNQNTAPVNLVTPITSFVLGISLNITSLGVFTSTPPATPLNLDTCFLQGPKFEGTSETVANNLSTTIDSWVKTAIAVNNSTGVQVNWG